MTVALSDRTAMTVSSTGTGTITLSGALGAVAPNLASYQSFAGAGVADQQTVSYVILDANGAWEYGRGLYSSSGTSLTRGPLASSNSGSAINMTASAQVFVTLLVEDLVGTYQLGGFVNKFRNGAFDIWQRGTGAITVTTADAYVADGWIVSPSGTSCTAQRASNNRSGAGSLYGMQVTGAASVTDITVTQRIESYLAVALAGERVTVQAQIYNNTGSSITPTLTTKYAGSADNWTSPTTDLSATNLQACANGAWTQVAYTLAVSANATAGYEFIFDFGNDFTTTAKDVIIAEADVRVTPGLATGLCANPPPPELRPLAAELPFNERYFQTSYDLGVAPGTATTVGLVGGSPTYYEVTVGPTFATRMRADPTVSVWDGAGASGHCSSTGNGNGTFINGENGVTVFNTSQRGFGYYPTGTSGYSYYIHYAVSAEL